MAGTLATLVKNAKGRLLASPRLKCNNLHKNSDSKYIQIKYWLIFFAFFLILHWIDAAL